MAHKIHRRIVAVAACLLLCLSAVQIIGAQHAAAAPKQSAGSSSVAFGVQYHGMWSSYSDAQRTEMLQKLQAAGVQWVRLDLGWAMLQPTAGHYDMTWGVPFADHVIDQIHSMGFHLLVTFWRTPGWANDNAGETTLPDNPADYAKAIQWAANRYAGKVDAWEIWNEPNEDYSMTGASPKAYASLLRAAYPAVHAGDPDAQVVFGGPSENDTPWIAKAYAAGIHGYFDVMATHPYMGPSNAPPNTPDDDGIYTMAHVATVHDLMAAHGDGDKPIWFTEFGWSSHANTPGMANWELGVSEQRQADYLVQSLQVIQQQFPYVTHAFWYETADQNTGARDNIDNYGLLTSSLQPKPAYDAIRSYLTSGDTSSATSDNSASRTTTKRALSTVPTGAVTAELVQQHHRLRLLGRVHATARSLTLRRQQFRNGHWLPRGRVRHTSAARFTFWLRPSGDGLHRYRVVARSRGRQVAVSRVLRIHLG